jgi:hypothetical protein
LADLLRELDEKLGQDGMPAGARNRIELQIRGHERQHGRWRRWLPACTFAAGAALVLAVIGLRVPDDVQQQAPAPVAVSAAVTLGAFALTGDSCESTRRGASARMRGECHLVADHMTVRVWNAANVEARDDGLRLRSGEALFDVDPVRPGDASVKVVVSHGTIEVVGTRFAVSQSEDGGHVDLFEGKISFHDDDGTEVEILPGQRHAWGAEAPEIVAVVPDPEPEVEDTIEVLPEAEKRDRRPTLSERREAVVQEVEDLRAAARYREAVRVLRAANKKRWDDRTAQILSYELGELLHRFIADDAAACKHLQEHQRRFPRGRYHAAVEEALDKLSCGSR